MSNVLDQDELERRMAREARFGTGNMNSDSNKRARMERFGTAKAVDGTGGLNSADKVKSRIERFGGNFISAKERKRERIQRFRKNKKAGGIAGAGDDSDKLAERAKRFMTAEQAVNAPEKLAERAARFKS